MEEAGTDATVILVSDHGFHSGDLRPLRIPREPAGPAVWHRHYGIFVMRGPGIKKDERIYGASILDICPTILCFFGLPTGLDMDGKPLVGAFEEEPAVSTIPSHDAVAGPAGMHRPDVMLDPVEASEAIDRLVALGYIDKPGEDQGEAAKKAVCELRYNLARSYTDANRHVDAIPILEQLFENRPDEYRFGIQLVACYQAMDWLFDARRVLEHIFRRREEDVLTARERLSQLAEEWKGRQPGELSQGQVRETIDLRERASFNSFAMYYLMGTLLFSEGKTEAALEFFQKAEVSSSGSPSVHLQLGMVYLRMKRWDDAGTSFNKALELDQDCAEAYRGLGLSHLHRSRNQDAARAALDAVARIYFDPVSHFVLGVALHRLGEIQEAVKALKIAVLQNPNYPQAHRRLSSIYRNRLHDAENAAIHHALASEASRRIARIRRNGAGDRRRLPTDIEHTSESGFGSDGRETEDAAPRTLPIVPWELAETIVIVTGLPRSGTSMMMQILSAGGISPLTDGRRAADADNPEGYYEFEPAKGLHRDNSWLAEAKGRAVKIVAQMLPHISADFAYRVIFMEREMQEVLESQKRMLGSKLENAEKQADGRLAATFTAQISLVKRMLDLRSIPSIFIRYERAIAEPLEVASKINAFLGGKLNESAMAAAVKPMLRRVIHTKTP